MHSSNQSTPNEFNDELLSAYLDDELSSEERALVEKRLATNAAAKQLVDELRALSASLQSLPKQTLDTTSSETILKAVAARQTPLVPNDNSKKREATTSKEKASVDHRSEDAASTVPFRIGRSKRGLVWSAMAIAAALLLMFIQGEWQGNPQDMVKNEAKNEAAIKVAKSDSKSVAARSAEGKKDAAADTDTADGINKDKRLSGRAAKMKAAEGSLALDAKAKKNAAELADEARADSPKFSSPAFSAAPEGVAENGGGGGRGSSGGRGRIASRSAPIRAKRSANTPATLRTNASIATSQNSLRMLVARKRTLLPEEVSQNVTVLQNVALSNGVAVDPKEPMLIVQLDLSEKAFHSQAFQNVLRRNRIRVEDRDEALLEQIEPTAGEEGQGLDGARETEKSARDIKNRAVKEGKETAESKPILVDDFSNGKHPAGKQAPANTAGAKQAKTAADGKPKNQANTPSLFAFSGKQEPPVSDAFYVRGTMAQVQATLGDLQKDTNNFKLLNAQTNGPISPEPNWASYNRGLEKPERKEMSVAMDGPTPKAPPVALNKQADANGAGQGDTSGKEDAMEESGKAEMPASEDDHTAGELETAKPGPSNPTGTKQSSASGYAGRPQGGKRPGGENRSGEKLRGEGREAGIASKEPAPVQPVPSVDAPGNAQTNASNKGNKNGRNKSPASGTTASSHSDSSLGQAFRLYDPAVLNQLSQRHSSRQQDVDRINDAKKQKKDMPGASKSLSQNPKARHQRPGMVAERIGFGTGSKTSGQGDEALARGDNPIGDTAKEKPANGKVSKAQAPKDEALRGRTGGLPPSPAAQAKRFHALSAAKCAGKDAQKQIAVVFVLRIVPDEPDASASGTAAKRLPQNRKEHNQRPGKVAEPNDPGKGNKTSEEASKPKPAAERPTPSPEAPAKTPSNESDD